MTENLNSADNGRYIENIADWLEQSSSAESKGSILAYDLSGSRSPLALNALLPESARNERSFQVTNRQETPVISAQLLKKHSQVWLFFGADKPLSATELNALSAFSQNGGSLLIVAGNGANIDAINRLSSRFGVHFYGRSDSGDKIPVAVASPMFYRAAEMIGRFLKLTHKA
jgi:hypothetical protein